MPTYEYICEKCGQQFEKFQSMKDEPLTVCPKELCEQKRWAKGKVKRQMGAGAGLIFKGSGFYITDYRSDKYKDAAKKDSNSSSSSSSSSTTSSTSSSTTKSSDAPSKPKSESKAAKKAS